MKKIVLLILLTSFIWLLPAFIVQADIGPKRTLEVEIIGVEKDYHIELLMQGDLPEGDELAEIQANLEDQYDHFPEILYTFDSGGYVASNLVLPWGAWHQNTKENYYFYGYNPPSDFKVMLIFDDDHYVISRAIETTLFNSKVTFDVTGVNLELDQQHVGRINEVFPVRTMTLELVLRILGTIFIEILVLFLFGYIQKNSYRLIIVINLITQIVITGFMFAAKYFIFPVIGELFVLIVGEAMIFLSEIIIYRFYLVERTKNRAMLYALIANLISLIASYSVMILMMNM
ncbi:MAG: hypothetical protein WC992_02030 [Acholeplasmataceae bacterium]|jgi:hypothetical protein|nr:hypothetical protein [Acholeplasmataceae bacterium]